MNTFFEEEGILNIDELIMEQYSFQKIMEDGVVTSEELQEQSARVISSLKAFEQSALPEQIDQVRKILAEISVLVAVRDIYEKQLHSAKYTRQNTYTMEKNSTVTPLSVYFEIEHRVIKDENSPFKKMLSKAKDIDIDYFEKISRSRGSNRLSEELNLGLKDQVVDAFCKMADSYYVDSDLLEQLKSLAIQEIENTENKEEFLATLTGLLEWCADRGVPSAGWSRYSNTDLQELYKNAKEITLKEFFLGNNVKDILEFYSALMDNTWWTCRELIVERTKTFLRDLSKEIRKAAQGAITG